jgi:hypothetical protein
MHVGHTEGAGAVKQVGQTVETIEPSTPTHVPWRQGATWPYLARQLVTWYKAPYPVVHPQHFPTERIVDRQPTRNNGNRQPCMLSSADLEDENSVATRHAGTGRNNRVTEVSTRGPSPTPVALSTSSPSYGQDQPEDDRQSSHSIIYPGSDIPAEIPSNEEHHPANATHGSHADEEIAQIYINSIDDTNVLNNGHPEHNLVPLVEWQVHTNTVPQVWCTNSIAEARANGPAIPQRVPINIVYDDWQYLNTSEGQRPFVERTIAAFRSMYQPFPDMKKSGESHTKMEMNSWFEWQERAQKKVNEIFDNEHTAGAEVNAAWLLVGEVRDVHKKGIRHINFSADKNSNSRNHR